MQTIDLERLSEVYRDPGLKLVDCRPSHAYNGWPMRDEVRGGHIPGARLFPRSWAENSYDAVLMGQLAQKGLTPDIPLIVYGHDEEDAMALARRLMMLGYDDLTVLDGGLSDWAARDDLEMSRLPRYTQLVYPQWVHRQLSGGEPGRGGHALYHVNWGVPEEYERGHIPGAFYLNTESLESPVDWNRRTPEELEETLLRLGITRDTTVILYGRDTATDPKEQKPGRRAGQIAATRAAAILLYCGVEDVRLLDGGLNAWLAAGYDVETERHSPQPVDDFGVEIPARPDYFIDFDEAVDLLADPDGVLVSIRSRPENLGHTSGYNYIPEVGDIPGAVWGDCGTDAYHMQYYRSMDNTMRDFNEIASDWSTVGITADKKIAFYCGTGWRASETFFYAYLMGWPRVAIYDGGWFEWSKRAGMGQTGELSQVRSDDLEVAE